MTLKVVQYELRFNPKANGGRISIMLENDSQPKQIPLNSNEEFIAVALLLSNKVVHLDTSNGLLFTPWINK